MTLGGANIRRVVNLAQKKVRERARMGTRTLFNRTNSRQSCKR
jgi:hypothetical protein